MKFKSFLLVFGVVFFIGCASGPAVSETETVKEETVKEETVIEESVNIEEKKEPVKIVTTVYYPVKVESYFGDGVKDEYSVYLYDKEGALLLKEELINADDTLQQYVVSEYIGAESCQKNTFDAAGTLISYETNKLDKDGNILKREIFDNKDVLQSVSEYEYRDDMKSVWKVFNETGSLLGTTVYIYSDSKLTKIDSMNPGGDLEEYFELIYTGDGLLSENNHYNAENKIQDSRFYDYKDGFLVMELVKRKNGSVLRKIMYKNDQFGNPVETVFMDAGDNVQERLITVYESREEISYEK